MSSKRRHHHHTISLPLSHPIPMPRYCPIPNTDAFTEARNTSPAQASSLGYPVRLHAHPTPAIRYHLNHEPTRVFRSTLDPNVRNRPAPAIPRDHPSAIRSLVSPMRTLASLFRVQTPSSFKIRHGMAPSRRYSTADIIRSSINNSAGSHCQKRAERCAEMALDI